MSFCQELCVLVFWVSAISPTLAWSWRYSEHWDQIFCTQPEKVSLGTIFVKFSLGIKLTELWPPASTTLCTHYGERFSHTPNQPLAVGNWFIFLYQDGLHTLNSCWVCDWNVYHLCCANTGRVVLQCESSDIKRVSISRVRSFRLLFAVSRGVPPGSVTCLRNLIYLTWPDQGHAYILGCCWLPRSVWRKKTGDCFS